MRPLRIVDLGEDRVDLVRSLVSLATDLELHQGCVAALGDLAGVALVGQGANVLNYIELRDPRDNVLARGPEGWIGRRERAALDQNTLVGRPLEARVENAVHPTGLARPVRVRIDHLR